VAAKHSQLYCQYAAPWPTIMNKSFHTSQSCSTKSVILLSLQHTVHESVTVITGQ